MGSWVVRGKLCKTQYHCCKGNTSAMWRHSDKFHEVSLKEAGEAALQQPTISDAWSKHTDFYKQESPRKKILDDKLVI